MIRRPPRSTLFPSPPLFRSGRDGRPDYLHAVVAVRVDGARAAARVLEPPERVAERGLRRDEGHARSEEHTSELQSRQYLVCRLLLEKKKKQITTHHSERCNH